MRGWLAAMAFLLLPAFGHAAAAMAPLDCAKDRDNSRCAWIEAGEPDLPQVADDGDEVIRIQGMSMRIRGNFLMELRHPRDGGYQLVIRNPYATDAALVRPISRRDWNALAAMRVAMLTSHLQYKNTVGQYGRDYLCVDSPGLAVDSVLRGTVDHYQSNYDCRFPAVFDFFERAPKRLYRLVPDCMKLHEALRNLCGALAGDMASARAALPYVVQMEWHPCNPEHEPDAPDVGRFIAPDAELSIESGPSVEGGTWRGREILGTFCRREYGFTPHRVIGEDAQVRVDGTVRRYWQEPGVDKDHPVGRSADAPSTQVWRIDRRTAVLERWTIGDFGPPR